MANEIIVMDTRGARSDGTFVGVGFFYAISSPKVLSNGTVVPSASSTLPYLATLSVTSEQRAALDQGGMVFEEALYFYDPSLTTAQHVSNLRAQYSVAYTEYLAVYERRLWRAGTSISSI